MKHHVWILTILVALLSCGRGASDASKGSAPGKGGRGGGLSFAVDVMPIEAKKLSYIVTAPGTVDAFEHVQVTARVAGAVDTVAFAEGQQVKKGEVLVVIDSARFHIAENTAEALLLKARGQAKDDRAQVARRQGASAANPGLVPVEELQSYSTKTLAARADVAVAQEALKGAQLNMRDSEVKAPMDGIIQTRTVETGQYVQAGYVMATLLQTNPMLLRFQVEPQDAPRIKPGMVATFTMRESNQTYTAKITLVSGAADPTAHMVPITAEVEDTGHRFWLRPGSFCDVELDIGAQRDAPLIPRVAARATDHGYVAYVVTNKPPAGADHGGKTGGGKKEATAQAASSNGEPSGPGGAGGPPEYAEERVLNLGMNTRDGWVEVRAGLAAGELLVVHGAEALSNGTKVHAKHVTAESVRAGVAAAAGIGVEPPKRPAKSASVAPAAATETAAPERAP